MNHLVSGLVIATLAVLTAAACQSTPEDAEPVRFRVPPGAGVGTVADTLAERDLISSALLFRVYARVRTSDRPIQPGVYEMRPGSRWGDILDGVEEGRVLTYSVAVPEGWTIMQIAENISSAAGISADSVRAVLTDSSRVEDFDLPGPTFEGYLYPATYRIPEGTGLDEILSLMVRRYQRTWTPERRARADSMGLSEREVVTLASIIEREARVWDERETISAVYLNRLEIGMPLQADPTVQYALGEHQSRLLYAHIDEVEDNPYNTYRHPGLPPGPIASPSTGAIDAALNPADVDYLFFVARPDGTHIFTHNFDEHRQARAQVNREAREREAEGR